MFDCDRTSELSDGDALCSIEEIVNRIERRLAWYGLPSSGVRAVALDGTDQVVATVTVAGNGTFCEIFDRRTGCMRRRESLDAAA